MDARKVALGWDRAIMEKISIAWIKSRVSSKIKIARSVMIWMNAVKTMPLEELAASWVSSLTTMGDILSSLSGAIKLFSFFRSVLNLTFLVYKSCAVGRAIR